MHCSRARCMHQIPYTHTRIVMSVRFSFVSPLLFAFVAIHLGKIFIQRIYRAQYTHIVHRLRLPMHCLHMKWGVVCVRNAIILLLLSLIARISYVHFSKNLEFFSNKIKGIKKNRYMRKCATVCVHVYTCCHHHPRFPAHQI